MSERFEVIELDPWIADVEDPAPEVNVISAEELKRAERLSKRRERDAFRKIAKRFPKFREF